MIVETKPDTIKNVKETQKIRLWVDLIVIPALLLSIVYKGKVSKLDTVLLFAIGGVTVAYNLGNYIKFKNEG